MASLGQVAVLLAVAMCMLALVASAQPRTFTASGRVYCDPCRRNQVTRLSAPMGGARVRLECRKWSNGELTYSKEAVTYNGDGYYAIVGAQQNQDDICDTMLVQSSRPDCSEIIDTGLTTEPEDGPRIKGKLLSYTKRVPDPECAGL